MVQKNSLSEGFLEESFKPKIVVIAGPTAVGKSSLGIEVARHFDGEIISADSMQIYRGFDIGTGKVTREEMQNIPHHMLDILEPNESYSVALYVKNVRKLVKEITARKKLPVIVGGTGLFIRALLEGFNFGDAESPEIRKFYTEYLKAHGNKKLHNLLAKKDSDAAKNIHPNKTRAVIRALEIIDSSQKKFSELVDNEQNFDHLLIGLNDDREVLYQRINTRVDKMFEDGLIDEVSGLKSAGAKDDSQAMRGIGYKEVIGMLSGEYDPDRAKELVKQHARNYAKRQLTWLRKMKGIEWFTPVDLGLIINRIQEFLSDKNSRED